MSGALAARVLEHIRGERELMLTLLAELTEAESPSKDPDIHDRVRRALVRMYGELGLAVREVGTPTTFRPLATRSPSAGAATRFSSSSAITTRSGPWARSKSARSR